MNDNQRIIKV